MYYRNSPFSCSHSSNADDGECSNHDFDGVGTDALADLTVCLRSDGHDTVNGNAMDANGGKYEIMSVGGGSHVWLVADIEKLEQMSSNSDDGTVGLLLRYINPTT